MDELITQLNKILSSNATISCFAINLKKSPQTGILIDLSSERLYNFMASTLDYLCKRVYNKMQLGDYPEATPKDYIERICCTNSDISELISNIKNIPLLGESDNKDLNSYNAYMIIVEDESHVDIFLTKKKPLLSCKKKRIHTHLFQKSNTNDSYTEITDDIIRLVRHFDAFILDDTCYIVTKEGRAMLGLEKSRKEKCHEVLEQISSLQVLDQYGLAILKEYLRKPGQFGCLAGADEKLLQELSHITHQNKEHIQNKYHLDVIEDRNGVCMIDVRTQEQMKAFIDTITLRRGQDFDANIVTCAAPFKRHL